MREKSKSKSKKIIKVIGISLLIILVMCVGGFLFYTSDYSRAQDEAIAAMEDSGVAVTTFDGGVAFGNTKAQTGFIFYPGGKVEYTAYAPLLQKIAGDDILCILAKMPLNLAVFDSGAAADLTPLFPEVEQWFIGGHSLGGAMAASYAAQNPKDFMGLILLAAYPPSDISTSELAVISIYGSEDTVLNEENFNAARSLMPADYKELCIQGGNHAQFGDYGLQDGDGTALIPATEQRETTSNAIIEFITTHTAK